MYYLLECNPISLPNYSKMSVTFLEAPFDTYHISPIGVATGKYSDKKCLIIDLSAPYNDLKHCFY